MDPRSSSARLAGRLRVRADRHVTNAGTQGVNGVMISNCAGDQIEPAVKQATDAGATVVSWDSPIPSGEGESVFVAQVDFDETGP